MKILWNDKDGGPDSKVWCWGIEIKPMFSVLLLKFGEGSREAYHNHAFHALSWLFHGALREFVFNEASKQHKPSVIPIVTPRSRFHKVYGITTDNLVLTFRGPWSKTWKEVNQHGKQTLTHNRVVVKTE